MWKLKLEHQMNHQNFELTPEEAIALYKELEHQFINYDSLATSAVRKLEKFVRSLERKEQEE